MLLQGAVGAGKSVFARALIRHALITPETDIPSPSFTLVQTYQGQNSEIWHADLYRLSDPDEIVELGLEDAFTQAITLIEWPERLEQLRPARYINLGIKPVLSNPDMRDLSVEFVGDGWENTQNSVQDFLQKQGSN